MRTLFENESSNELLIDQMSAVKRRIWLDIYNDYLENADSQLSVADSGGKSPN